MNLNMREILKIFKKMDKGLRNILMGHNMKVIFLTIKKMDLEYINLQMEKYMKGILRMIYMKERGDMYGE